MKRKVAKRIVHGSPPGKWGVYEKFQAFRASVVTGVLGTVGWLLWFLSTYEFPWMQSAGGYWAACAVFLGPPCAYLYQLICDNRKKKTLVPDPPPTGLLAPLKDLEDVNL